MEQFEKINFVTEVSARVAQAVIDDIRAGKVPEHWNGIELRQLIADRHTSSSSQHLLSQARKKSYENDVLIHNL